MGRLLAIVFEFVISDLGFKVLTSLGLSIGTSVFISSIIDDYIKRAINNFNTGALFGDVLAFANIAKIDVCLSIVIGGIIFVASYKSLKIMFTRA